MGSIKITKFQDAARLQAAWERVLKKCFSWILLTSFFQLPKSSKYTDKNSISKFVTIYAGERLFYRVKNRQFKGFENFMNVVDMKKPEENANEANEIFNWLGLDKEKYACGN